MGQEHERILGHARDTLLAAMPGAWAIYAYGSFASGEEWPQSDVDLAVLLPPGQTIPDLLGTSAAVAACVGRNVDLVDLRQAGDVLRSEVLAKGRVVYTAKPDLVLDWEASAMSRYARHREEVRELLEDFRRTGVGYGR